jgi:hypothetical protein
MRRLELADFVALYRGRTVTEAELVAVSAESRIVRQFFAALLGESESRPEGTDGEQSRRMLEAVRDE